MIGTAEERTNYLDLFSGIGGFALAARRAGLNIGNHYNSDIEEYANRVYAKNFPTSIQLGDVRNIDGRRLRAKHGGRWIVTGGFPCQDISTAGKRAGIDGDRSNLWYEMHRIIGELRPDYVVAENVPALCYRGLDQVLRSLADIGFDAEWQVVSAASVGAPHLRKRVWVVAYPTVHGCEYAAQPHPAPAWADLADREQSDGSPNRAIVWADWDTTAAEAKVPSVTLFPRVDDGLSGGLDTALSRIKSLGNAIVPQVAEPIFNKIKFYISHPACQNGYVRQNAA